MGVDIRAYRKIRLVENGDLDSDQSLFVAWVNPDFPGRAEGIVHRGTYAFESQMSGYSSSYGGYNRDRRLLAELCGHTDVEYWRFPEAKDWPFYELINFSDCEGTLGTEVCREIAKDFQQLSLQTVDVYRSWQRMFEFACDDGCVRFS